MHVSSFLYVHFYRAKPVIEMERSGIEIALRGPGTRGEARD